MPGLFPLRSLSLTGWFVTQHGQHRDTFGGDEFLDKVLYVKRRIVAVQFADLLELGVLPRDIG